MLTLENEKKVVKIVTTIPDIDNMRFVTDYVVFQKEALQQANLMVEDLASQLHFKDEKIELLEKYKKFVRHDPWCFQQRPKGFCVCGLDEFKQENNL